MSNVSKINGANIISGAQGNFVNNDGSVVQTGAYWLSGNSRITIGSGGSFIIDVSGSLANVFRIDATTYPMLTLVANTGSGTIGLTTDGTGVFQSATSTSGVGISSQVTATNYSTIGTGGGFTRSFSITSNSTRMLLTDTTTNFTHSSVFTSTGIVTQSLNNATAGYGRLSTTTTSVVLDAFVNSTTRSTFTLNTTGIVTNIPGSVFNSTITHTKDAYNIINTGNNVTNTFALDNNSNGNIFVSTSNGSSTNTLSLVNNSATLRSSASSANASIIASLVACTLESRSSSDTIINNLIVNDTNIALKCNSNGNIGELKLSSNTLIINNVETTFNLASTSNELFTIQNSTTTSNLLRIGTVSDNTVSFFFFTSLPSASNEFIRVILQNDAGNPIDIAYGRSTTAYNLIVNTTEHRITFNRGSSLNYVSFDSNGITLNTNQVLNITGTTNATGSFVSQLSSSQTFNVNFTTNDNMFSVSRDSNNSTLIKHDSSYNNEYTFVTQSNNPNGSSSYFLHNASTALILHNEFTDASNYKYTRFTVSNSEASLSKDVTVNNVTTISTYLGVSSGGAGLSYSNNVTGNNTSMGATANDASLYYSFGAGGTYGLSVTNLGLYVNGSITIGDVVNNTPANFSQNDNSILTLTSTSKGLQVPRMTTAQRNSVSWTAQDAGMIIFNTDVTTNGKHQGYDGTAWNNLY